MRLVCMCPQHRGQQYLDALLHPLQAPLHSRLLAAPSAVPSVRHKSCAAWENPCFLDWPQRTLNYRSPPPGSGSSCRGKQKGMPAANSATPAPTHMPTRRQLLLGFCWSGLGPAQRDHMIKLLIIPSCENSFPMHVQAAGTCSSSAVLLAPACLFMSSSITMGTPPVATCTPSQVLHL